MSSNLRNSTLALSLSMEQDRLVRLLQDTEEYKLLQKLNDLAEVYGGKKWIIGYLTPPSPPAPNPDRKEQNVDIHDDAEDSHEQARPRKFGYGEKTRAVEEAAVAFLSERGARATSGDFLPYLQSLGIELGGKSPARTVASFLTTSSRFNNVKPLGYGLIEWGNSDGPKAKKIDLLNNSENSPAEETKKSSSADEESAPENTT